MRHEKFRNDHARDSAVAHGTTPADRSGGVKTELPQRSEEERS